MTDNGTLSRRAFLATTTAAAAAAAATLAAGGGSLMADSPQSSSSDAKSTALRWGVIGTGTRGNGTHVRVLKDAPGSQIVALCDVAEARLQSAVANVTHPVKTYSDYQKLLADPDVNAVVIATPNLFHREMLAAALQAGKHVLCEKPTGVGPEQAADMKRMAESAKTVVMFGMQYRHNPRPRQVQELIGQGKIGKPRYIVQSVSRGDWNLSPNVWKYADPKLAGGEPRNWRFSHAASGGTLNEFSCHYFDLLHWVAGALPERISCDGGIAVYHDGRDTWDHATVTLNYPGGLTAVHTLSMFAPNRHDFLVFGDEGAIEMTGEGLRLTSNKRGRSAGTGPRAQDVPAPQAKRRSADDSTLALYDDFLACVQTGKKPDAGPDRAVAASRTCWLAELASERRAEVKWDDLA